MVAAYSPLVVALPFAAFVIAVAMGDRLPRKGAVVGSLAAAGALVLSVLLAVTVAASGTYTATVWRWAAGADGVTLSFGVLVDPLSTMMLIIVSLIALLVHVFSLGYMNAEGERDLPRYYAGLGLFTASMLGFVIADNLLMAFIFFELVGLCSYLLIGFWYREEAPPSAAKKAFLVTRFGDYFFLIGVVAVFATFGTARFVGPMAFPTLAEAAIAGEVTVRTFGLSPQTWITVVGLLILGGVLGKSAQFPLHTWLPDAMEGPTPVSALIHAATMVAAGVYLVARMYGFYAVSPDALAIIALVGGFTALFAATMGVVKREIKQVLAYSTISQYGYMLLGLGAGGYVAATFHLLTHAFFKALLFLGAGAVIIAMHHHEDMWEMGGLRRRMPVTYVTFLAGSLALAGIVPFAGFWSKDEVLYETLIHALGGSTARGGVHGVLHLPDGDAHLPRHPPQHTRRRATAGGCEHACPTDRPGRARGHRRGGECGAAAEADGPDGDRLPPPVARRRHGRTHRAPLRRAAPVRLGVSRWGAGDDGAHRRGRLPGARRRGRARRGAAVPRARADGAHRPAGGGGAAVVQQLPPR
jgi:NADH-quinone oxidoreductase subunit L